mgnify:FL=1
MEQAHAHRTPLNELMIADIEREHNKRKRELEKERDLLNKIIEENGGKLPNYLIPHLIRSRQDLAQLNAGYIMAYAEELKQIRNDIKEIKELLKNGVV